MDNASHNAIVNFIWGIADDVLRHHMFAAQYRDVILPMTVIRRLDALLEPKKQKVLQKNKELKRMTPQAKHPLLCKVSGFRFYNTSQFTLATTVATGRRAQLHDDFTNYLNGFSGNVGEILNKFNFSEQARSLSEKDILANVIAKFLHPQINLSPRPAPRPDGGGQLPPLDNHGMGVIFEELIRRFNEKTNIAAGQFFTPRDVVNLMADLIVLPVKEKICSTTYTIYDGACGTGGMLTVAEERIKEIAKQQGKQVSIHLFGQEIHDQTYAIAKADMLVKGEKRDNIVPESTISKDAFAGQRFNFMLSNPPYGMNWENDRRRMTNGGADDPRFVTKHEDQAEYKMLPRKSDGQLLFLANNVAKMKTGGDIGSRIAEVHNGSALFTGDAGSGESNIRRRVIENDWLEAVVALPENMFYNTSIATYVWLLSSKKSPEREGYVQLINAVNWFNQCDNLGKKNRELSEKHIQDICKLAINPADNEYSKMLPNEAFGYRKVTIERPLRLAAILDKQRISKLAKQDNDAADIVRSVARKIGEGPHRNWNVAIGALCKEAKNSGVTMSVARKKLLREHLAVVDEKAKPVVCNIHKQGKKPNPLVGLFAAKVGGKPCVVEYEPDAKLREIEEVPLREKGGVGAFFSREVLPYADDAWIDESTLSLIGYEINFARYFYKPAPMRPLAKIRADILALEKEAECMLDGIVGGGDDGDAR